nr:hypothetical protein 9 [bacterium]
MNTKEAQVQALNEATEKGRIQERKRLIIDFDKAVEEVKDNTVLVKFQDHEFELPDEAPAWLPLFIARRSNEDGVISDTDNLELIAKLLGNKFADAIVESDSNISFNLVNEKVLMPIMAHWGFGTENVDSQGED